MPEVPNYLVPFDKDKEQFKFGVIGIYNTNREMQYFYKIKAKFCG